MKDNDDIIWLKFDEKTQYFLIVYMYSKKISNDQESTQSDPTSYPQNQKGNN